MRITITQNQGRKPSRRTSGKSTKTARKTTRTTNKRGEYSAAEKAAYNAGKGFAAAKAGGTVQLKTEKEKQSFRNGMSSVGKKKGAKKGK